MDRILKKIIANVQSRLIFPKIWMLFNIKLHHYSCNVIESKCVWKSWTVGVKHSSHFVCSLANFTIILIDFIKYNAVPRELECRVRVQPKLSKEQSLVIRSRKKGTELFRNRKSRLSEPSQMTCWKLSEFPSLTATLEKKGPCVWISPKSAFSIVQSIHVACLIWNSKSLHAFHIKRLSNICARTCSWAKLEISTSHWE